MGAWGSGIFENDTACDFAVAVADGGGTSALAEAIDRVLAAKGGYLEAPDAQEGLAAADIIARLRGRPGQQTSYTATVDAWISASGAKASDELVDKARLAIARIIAAPSELLELWTESENFGRWKNAVEEVALRL